MPGERRRPARSPEDEGIPDFDEDLRRKRLTELDEELPLPGDRPLGANDLVTPAEQRDGETVRTRVAREIPDDVPDRTDDQPGRMVEETEDGKDVTRELVADETDDRAGLTAEEAAVHVVEDEDAP